MSRGNIFRLLAFTLVVMLFAPINIAPISAAGTVTDCATDQGLVDAINSGSRLITFSCGPAPVTITTGLTVISGSSYTIDGGNLVTLSGNDSRRLFNIQPGAALTLTNIILTNGYSRNTVGGAVYVSGGTLVLNHATIQNSSTSAAGGAIFAENGGHVTLTNNSVVQGNTSDYGAISSTGDVTIIDSLIQYNVATTSGGALSVSGNVTISDTQISNNRAADTVDSEGGGIYITAPGNVSISNSLIQNNIAPAGGGLSIGGNVTISNTQISNNWTVGSGGGGLYITAQGNVSISNSQITSNRDTVRDGGGIANLGTLTLTQSIVSGNAAERYGGGIINFGSETLLNVSVSGNSAQYGAGNTDIGIAALLNRVTFFNNNAILVGGGFWNEDNTSAVLTNVTFSGNSAGFRGGGMVNESTGTLLNVTFSGNSSGLGGGGAIAHFGAVSGNTLTLKNTIVADSPAGGNCFVLPGSPTNIASSGFNLSRAVSRLIYEQA